MSFSISVLVELKISTTHHINNSSGTGTNNAGLTPKPITSISGVVKQKAQTHVNKKPIEPNHTITHTA